MIVLDSAKTWWAERSPRERWMLGGLAVALVGLVLWYGVLTPALALADHAQARRREAAADLAMIEAAGKGLSGQPAGPATQQPLMQAIDASATAAGVAIERRREDAGGKVTVWVSAIEPRILMQWILALRASQGVAVVGMTASKADAAALEVEVSFARSGA